MHISSLIKNFGSASIAESQAGKKFLRNTFFSSLISVIPLKLKTKIQVVKLCYHHSKICFFSLVIFIVLFIIDKEEEEEGE